MTVYKILERLEEKYGIGIGISNYDDYQHCYLYGRKSGRDIEIQDKKFLPASAIFALLHSLFETDNSCNGLRINVF